MRELVSFLAKALVDHPDEVYTSTYDRSDSTVIELEVAEEGLGKGIGRQGRTARAVRTRLSAAGPRARGAARPPPSAPPCRQPARSPPAATPSISRPGGGPSPLAPSASRTASAE